MNYKLTGKNIPISVEDMMNSVINKLETYDKLQETGAMTDSSPYDDTIIYATKSGKYVKVPKEIQLNAIKVWNDYKNNENNNTDYVKANDKFNQFQELQNEKPLNMEVEDVEYNNETKKEVINDNNGTSKLKWIILVLIIIVGLVYYYKIIKN